MFRPFFGTIGGRAILKPSPRALWRGAFFGRYLCANKPVGDRPAKEPLRRRPADHYRPGQRLDRATRTRKMLSALPKMAKAAQSPKLKAAFEKHLAETEGQVERLDQVFASVDETPKGKT